MVYNYSTSKKGNSPKKQTMLDNEWREVLLKDVATEITVGYVGTMVSEYVKEGIPFLRSQNVDYLKINTDDIKFISPEFHKRLQKSSLSPDDVVIVRTGKPGTCAIIPKWLPVSNCSDLVIVRCGKDLDARFLAYFINSAASHHVAAYLVGAVQQHFNVSSTRNIKLKLPSISEQRTISHILDMISDKIELNNKMNKTLKDIDKAIFKHWFIDFEFPNEDGKPYRSSRGEMNDSELGDIPKGWTVVKFQDLTAKKKFAIVDGPFGTQLHSNEYVPTGISVIKITNLSYDGRFLEDKISYITEEKFNSLIRSAVYPGDILLAKTGDTIGKFSILPLHIEKALISSSILKISPNSQKFNKYYIYNIIRNLSEKEYWRSISAGSTRPTITLNDVKDILIICPLDKIMKQYYLIVDAFYRSIEENEIESRLLFKIRDSLLPKLMSGKIRVPVEVK